MATKELPEDIRDSIIDELCEIEKELRHYSKQFKQHRNGSVVYPLTFLSKRLLTVMHCVNDNLIAADRLND